MRTEELDLPADAIAALQEQGFIELHPPQAEAIPKVLTGKSLVASIPTASGKSLIGYCAALKKILVEGKRVLYIVPLKALASEKRDDFDRFSKLGISVGISIGDLDSDDRKLSDTDVIVATSEKADSLMRHGSKWIESVGLVIADEIHMLHDPGRGPTLEVSLTKMKRRNPDLQIIALSATISNSNDLAMWLDADLVKSDWRPIKLKEGIYFDKEITFTDGSRIELEYNKDEVLALVNDMLRSGGQCIVFVNSRRSAEALASRYCNSVAGQGAYSISEEDRMILEGDSESTAVGRKLASCVKYGIAFHHAGLTSDQRHYVESNFRSGKLKVIVATPTLAAGINLPARRVIVRDTTRFEASSGNSPIPVMEIKQMCGRAGRPGFDPYGEAVLMAKSLDDSRHLLEDYLECDSEEITSKLGNERVLKMHILGLIATEEVSSIDDIIDFLRDTFYGSQSALYGIEGAVENVVEFLVENEMVKEEDETLSPLPFGKRVSDLYIEPESAVILRTAVGNIKDDTEDLMILHAIASTPDVLGMYPKKADRDMLLDTYSANDDKFLVETPEDSDYDFEYFLSDLKTACMVEQWISEKEEDVILKTMGIGPGDIRARVDSMEWLTYAMIEIAVLFRPEVVKRLRRLLTRVKYGVREELIELVSMRGVGRARARTLYNNGIKTKKDIEAADFYTIANLPRIGNALAKSLKMQTDSFEGVPEKPVEPPKTQTPEKPVEETGRKRPKGQSTLFDF